MISAVTLVSMIAFSFTSCAAGNHFSKYDSYDRTDKKYDCELLDYITMPDYIGVKVPDLQYTVTDDDVQKEILKYRVMYTLGEDITDRPVQYLDAVVITTTCNIKDTGETYSDLVKNDETIVIGLDELNVEDIDDQVTGMSIGETKTFDFSFPDPYYPDLMESGVEAEMTVTVSSIEQLDGYLADYDNDFVSEYCGYSSTSNFETALKNQINSRYTTYLKDYERTLAWKYLVDGTTVSSYPENEFSTYLDSSISDYESSAEELGYTLDEYADYLGITLNDLRSVAEEDVYYKMRQEMILYVIGKIGRASCRERV